MRQPGTGLICAGGILASGGGLVTLGASVVTGFQAGGDKSDVQEWFVESDREVCELFGAIQEYLAETP